MPVHLDIILASTMFESEYDNYQTRHYHAEIYSRIFKERRRGPESSRVPKIVQALFIKKCDIQRHRSNTVNLEGGYVCPCTPMRYAML